MNTSYALVTGASRGIGRAIAKKLAKEGFYVFLNCKTSAEKLEELKKEIETQTPGSATCLVGDVGNPEDVRRMFAEIRKMTPAPDILINNAGIAHVGLLMDMTDEEWERIVSTNLSSVFYCCREAAPGMVSKKAGKIINISSMWGTSGASCEAAYSATKAGVHGLTKALAKELAPSNIAVNAIACGVIDTEMNSMFSEEEKQVLAEEIPAGRFATAEEVAEAVWALLQSPNYLTGQIVGFTGAY